jgi:cardiolipin synthase
MTIPNILTLARIALIPVIVALLFLADPAMRWWAFGLYVAIALTDFLDGWLARKLDQTSDLGALMDPIADKVLVAALIVALVARGDMAGWDIAAAVLVLAREFLVSGLREYLGARNAKLPVTKLAKWKTTAQFAAIALFILAPLFGADVAMAASVLWWISAALTLITGYGYVATAVAYLRPADDTGAG